MKKPVANLREIMDGFANEVVNINYPIIDKAESIEQIICLAVFMANDKNVKDLNQSKEYFEQIGECDNCPYVENCLACIINE
ncbi:MAG: hypothetical protein WCI88_07010 [Chloroflexota bacterium]